MLHTDRAGRHGPLEPSAFFTPRKESFCPCWAEIWPHAASLHRETGTLMFHYPLPMAKFFWGGRLSISVVEAVLFCTEKFISVCQRMSLQSCGQGFQILWTLCKIMFSRRICEGSNPANPTTGNWGVLEVEGVARCVCLGKDRGKLKSCYLWSWRQYLSGGSPHPLQIQDRVLLGSGTESLLA